MMSSADASEIGDVMPSTPVYGLTSKQPTTPTTSPARQ